MAPTNVLPWAGERPSTQELVRWRPPVKMVRAGAAFKEAHIGLMGEPSPLGRTALADVCFRRTEHDRGRGISAFIAGVHVGTVTQRIAHDLVPQMGDATERTVRGIVRGGASFGPEQESGAYSVHVWPEKAADGGLGLVVADVPVAFWPPSDDDLDQLA